MDTVDRDNVQNARVDHAETQSADDLMPLIYEQLSRLAASYLRREQSDQMLEPAMLVNEVYLRLAPNPPGAWKNREHFFAVAAKAMRTVLIDHARQRRSLKRGFGRAQVSLELVTNTGPRDVDIREVDEAIEALAKVNKRGSRIVELRYFAGLTQEQVARVLGVSRKTVVKDWAVAREWLAEALAETDATDH